MAAAAAASSCFDGKFGDRFLATRGDLTIELARPTWIDRVVFSSARGEQTSDQPKFAFVAEYRIEVSSGGEQWTEVANSHDRQPAHRVRSSCSDNDGAEQKRVLQRSRSPCTSSTLSCSGQRVKPGKVS